MKIYVVVDDDCNLNDKAFYEKADAEEWILTQWEDEAYTAWCWYYKNGRYYTPKEIWKNFPPDDCFLWVRELEVE